MNFEDLEMLLYEETVAYSLHTMQRIGQFHAK